MDDKPNGCTRFVSEVGHLPVPGSRKAFEIDRRGDKEQTHPNGRNRVDVFCTWRLVHNPWKLQQDTGGIWLTDQKGKRYGERKKVEEMAPRASALETNSSSLEETLQILRIQPTALARLLERGVLEREGGGVSRHSLDRLQLELSELHEGVSNPTGLETGEMTEEELDLLRAGRPGRLPWKKD